MPNEMFRRAAQMGAPQTPAPQGSDLGMMLAADFINSNPALRRAFQQHMMRYLVPQQMAQPQQQDVSRSISDLLMMSRGQGAQR